MRCLATCKPLHVVPSSLGATNSARMELITPIFLERQQPLQHGINPYPLLTPKIISMEAKRNPTEVMKCMATCKPLHPRKAKFIPPNLTRLHLADKGRQRGRNSSTSKTISTEAKRNPNEAMHCLATCQPLHLRQTQPTHSQFTRLHLAEEPWLLPKINTQQGVLGDWK